MKYAAKDYEVRIWYSAAGGDRCFVAQVLDMPGVMAHGDTREEAARQIQAALDLALEAHAEDGTKPPAPGSAATAPLGRLAGRIASKRKRTAARRNGRLGGRRRKAALSAIAVSG